MAGRATVDGLKEALELKSDASAAEFQKAMRDKQTEMAAMVRGLSDSDKIALDIPNLNWTKFADGIWGDKTQDVFEKLAKRQGAENKLQEMLAVINKGGAELAAAASRAPEATKPASETDRIQADADEWRRLKIADKALFEISVPLKNTLKIRRPDGTISELKAGDKVIIVKIDADTKKATITLPNAGMTRWEIDTNKIDFEDHSVKVLAVEHWVNSHPGEVQTIEAGYRGKLSTALAIAKLNAQPAPAIAQKPAAAPGAQIADREKTDSDKRGGRNN